MIFEYNRELLALAFRFYGRAIHFPFDEQTHELQHMFREIEKSMSDDLDATIGNTILSVINFYQGEEMKALQTEYARLFAPIDEKEPLIPLRVSEAFSGIDYYELYDMLEEWSLIDSSELAPDLLPHVLDLFSSIIEYEDPVIAENFFGKFLKNALPEICRKLYKAANINFYAEYARGLNELVVLLDQ